MQQGGPKLSSSEGNRSIYQRDTREAIRKTMINDCGEHRYLHYLLSESSAVADDDDALPISVILRHHHRMKVAFPE